MSHRFSPYRRPARDAVRPQGVDWDDLSRDYDDDELSVLSSYNSEVKKTRVTVWLMVNDWVDMKALKKRYKDDIRYDYVFWRGEEVPPTFVRGMDSAVLIASGPQDLKEMFDAARGFDAKNLELALVYTILSDEQKRTFERDLCHHLPFYWTAADVNPNEVVVETFNHIHSTEKWQRMGRGWNKTPVIVWVRLDGKENVVSLEFMKKHQFTTNYRYRICENPNVDAGELPRCRHVILVSSGTETIEEMYTHVKEWNPKSVGVAVFSECSREEKRRLNERLDGNLLFCAATEPETVETALIVALEQFEKAESMKEFMLNEKKRSLRRRIEREVFADFFAQVRAADAAAGNGGAPIAPIPDEN